LETRAAKAKEQVQKQASWQKFAKKSEKKGVHIAGIAGTSIFKTPDNPSVVVRFSALGLDMSIWLTRISLVGVTGSGKGMTEYQAKGKHKFDSVRSWHNPF